MHGPVRAGYQAEGQASVLYERGNVVLDCGVVKDACFSLLTTKPGPDVAPYHDRQIITLRPTDGLRWLKLDMSGGDTFRAPPAGHLSGRDVAKRW